VRQMTCTNCTLEQSGPRGLAWHPIDGELFREAVHIARAGRSYEALLLAQDTYIAKYGDMHGVDFRVVTKEVTVSFLGAFGEDKAAALNC
jgi:hypothetical protein